MSDAEATTWGMHAGKMGDADTLFLKRNYLALGWPEVGDLSKLRSDRDGFKTQVAQAYPDKKPGAVPVDAGQLFRFTHLMKPGDLVIFTPRQSREIHIGQITGPYQHAPNISAMYPNLRPVKWLKAFPRTHFSQGALYEIGSAMSLFQVRTYADEFRAALEGKPAPVPVESDDSVSYVAEKIEETTRDYVLKKLAQDLKGHPLAHFVGHLLERMGYRTRVAPAGPDGGVDIVAHKDELGFEPPIIKVQVKSEEGRIGDPVVSALYGKVSSGEYGLLVTLGTFTPPAKSFAAGKSNLRLIDGDTLVDLVLQYYETFDSRYKGLIPLRRVYVPEPLEDSDEYGSAA